MLIRPATCWTAALRAASSPSLSAAPGLEILRLFRASETTVDHPRDATQRPLWRLNAGCRQDAVYSLALSVEIEHYFRENAGRVQSNIMLWAAGKAASWGHAKALLRQIEKEKQASITGLEARALLLEQELNQGGGVDRGWALELVREELRTLSLEEEQLLWHAS
ncbi:hypothetical protein NDU88_000949 [Pleurodeles waltl]|uniref:Uncharacterized protein n=1 Tax=Pleurodeles waltl TaxID=8319 RepID=A0AAV7Q291_PLEWA|nr:hypothetical protein NDU88_000949 [Pleurodeles waltl]